MSHLIHPISAGICAPRALARGVGPLPTTSANVSGLPEARDADEILDQLGDAINLIIDGYRGSAEGIGLAEHAARSR